MTAATQDVVSPQYGVPESAYPNLIGIGVAASTTIYAETIVAVNASGYAVPASASTAVKVVGRCERQVVNQTTVGPGIGTNGALQVQVRQGAFYFGNPSSGVDNITVANLFQPCFVIDDNNVGLTDAGGTRPYAGIIYSLGLAGTSDAGRVAVFLGLANPYESDAAESGSAAFKAKAVVTALSGTYTGSTTGILTASANSAFGTQDGVTTLAVGDVVILPAGTTHITAATDAGPYQITALGASGAKWVLTRPDWWATGSVIPNGAKIQLSGDGTLFKATAWKSYAAQGTVVDSTDPSLYPEEVTTVVALSSGVKAIATIPVLSATKTNIVVTLNTLGGTYTTTTGYGLIVPPTAGPIGTCTFTVNALVSAGVVLTTDTSTVAVSVLNG
jgi:hypothetical protein